MIKIGKKNGEKVFFLPDNLFDFLEKPEFFADHVHLNKPGRELFSKCMASATVDYFSTRGTEDKSLVSNWKYKIFYMSMCQTYQCPGKPTATFVDQIVLKWMTLLRAITYRLLSYFVIPGLKTVSQLPNVYFHLCHAGLDKPAPYLIRGIQER